METVQQRWEVARGLIEHEDELTNQRMSWLLTLQGLLFTALTVGAGMLASSGDGRYHGPALLFLLSVIFAGAGSPLLILRPLEGARAQIHAVFYWWATFGRRPDDEWRRLPDEHRYPPIIGAVHGEYRYESYGIPAVATAPYVPWRSYWHLPRYLVVVWALVFGVWLWMVSEYRSAPDRPPADVPAARQPAAHQLDAAGRGGDRAPSTAGRLPWPARTAS